MKRTSVFLAAYLVLGWCGRSRAAAASIDTATAKGYFAEIQRLSREDGGRLWGVPLAGPVFFVDPVTQEVVANQADKEGKLTRQGDVWVGKLPDNIAPANTAIDWAGVRWTMVIWPLPELEHSRGRLMMHECFHRIQDGIGLPATNPNITHLDDKDGRIWMRLEMRALSEALSRSGKERAEAIRDALSFRARREALCGAPSAVSERELEMNEGLAEYTGLVLSGFGKPSLGRERLCAWSRSRRTRPSHAHSHTPPARRTAFSWIVTGCRGGRAQAHHLSTGASGEGSEDGGC